MARADLPTEPRSDVPDSDASSRTGEAGGRRWVAPRLEALPPLRDLTLQSTGISGDCEVEPDPFCGF